MKICDYCGEYKKVRKKFLLYGGRHRKFLGAFGFYEFNYCCKECSDAISIKCKIVEKEFLQEEKTKKEKWIRERNKLLREYKKR